MENLLMMLLVSITTVGVTVFWRTCIYTRGAIFRPVGRLLDRWRLNGCALNAKWKHKVLRFLSYPLGGCVYCSSFHFTYELFFLMNWKLQLGLNIWSLLVIIPFTHLLLIAVMHYIVNVNADIKVGDWDNIHAKLIDKPIDKPMNKPRSPLSVFEESILEQSKAGEN